LLLAIREKIGLWCLAHYYDGHSSVLSGTSSHCAAATRSLKRELQSLRRT
jgi:hypothetical protein